ncbi:undecaprenyldiphospho-muramoylpentapeptide beta-N-acetylglucosaminyltransferase [Peribacillus saganii]|uniref:UDP-N-acetylglucosamine--N-acetylmuramyl-(pentapeptide) pyrophosphoryl-undecaprenol N-acetylglucosamine transferase n=1 Tax=Peribacillus saganii TaxID=2303992 RepID=A0A372LK74_9BACI|nr:undecaprenyldiphospho-muramoylpentapeptide beta-N-acetylglucosaminyltransferase [Peribacillus saganii]RFU66426.1 undecaprenyldiphospho-muramoylpentapeptide beta-N-acetylglucosaminyltransferase [Peribacillus saganii]
MNKKAVFTGGGSAGHVTVNAALIPEFLKNQWKVTYIGSEKGIEKTIIEKEFPDISYHSISVGKLRRYFSIENIKDPFRVIKGIGQAFRILKRERPDFIFSKGGFVSVPVVLGAKLLKIPVIIHESDITPGLANKIAFPFAAKICTTFVETASFLPMGKTIHVGAVLRDRIFKGDAVKGKRICGFKKDKPVLLIMGGSLGATKINEAIIEIMPQLLAAYQIIHICGKGNVFSDLIQPGYAAFEYVHEEIFDFLAAADIVISRAGSNSIFEFLALQKPMLLIPLSAKASRGDQILNAQSFEQAGFASILKEEALTGTALLKEISDLYSRRSNFSARINEFRGFKRADEMYKMLVSLVQPKK